VPPARLFAVRVVVLGGTRFVGRAIVDELDRAGHEVLVVHRGRHEPEEAGHIQHLHVDRDQLPAEAEKLRIFRPDGAIDVSSMNGRDAAFVIRALPEGVRLVAISSGDVYRAFSSAHEGTQTDAVPLDESAPLRERGFFVAPDDENLEVEESYLARGGVVLRLGAVYGEHDYQRRHDFILRRIRAGRPRIPIGSGAFLFSRCYVGDVAVAARMAIEHAPPGEVFNVAEASTWSIRLLAQKIIEVAGAPTELVRVGADQLPKDLRITGLAGQHLLMDARKLRSTLGWKETDRDEALVRAVGWELAHPPDEDDLAEEGDPSYQDLDDFGADDKALSDTCVHGDRSAKQSQDQHERDHNRQAEDSRQEQRDCDDD
jgi:nucleoside-diphosphate-sugar epimerase